MVQKFHFRSFSNLDINRQADFFINSMNIMSSLETIQAIKNRAITKMDLQIGDQVLEVGCGHGEDAEKIANIITEKGRVFAIDSSMKMINEAKKRSTHNNVIYSLMRAEDLKFQDNYFSACHIDRLFIGHKDYHKVLKQILRVTKINGVISITDVDALSMVLYPFNSVTQKVIKYLHKSFVNPYIGRMIPELLIKNNMQNIKIFSNVLVINDFELLNKIFLFSDIIQDLILDKHITKLQAANWVQTMNTSSKKGSFLYGIMFFTVIGHKSHA